MRRHPFYDFDTIAIIGVYFLTIIVNFAHMSFSEMLMYGMSISMLATIKSVFIFLPSWIAIFRDASNRLPLFCIGFGELVCVQLFLLYDPAIFYLCVLIWGGALIWALVSEAGVPPKVMTMEDLEKELAIYSYLLSQNSISREEYEVQKKRLLDSMPSQTES